MSYERLEQQQLLARHKSVLIAVRTLCEGLIDALGTL